MKKIGFIVIALMAVLASLGVAFSMWSQTVTITGQVDTGNVSLSLTAPTGTWVYKDLTTDAMVIVKGTADVNAPYVANPTRYLPVGSAAVTSTLPLTCAPGSSGVTVNFAFNNLFPLVVGGPTNGTNNTWDIDFTLNNIGSIPVKLELGPPSLSGHDTGNIQIAYNNAQGNAYEGQQLEPQGHTEVVVSITVPDDNNAQNLSGTFSAVIAAVQWNEYVYNPGNPNPPSNPPSQNIVLVSNLQPDYGATNGGGVYWVYFGPADNYAGDSPGVTTLHDGRYAAPLYAGVTIDPVDHIYEDQGLFGFKPGNVPVATFATQTLTYDFEMQTGVNPPWVYIELNKGVAGDIIYQYVPSTNPAGWHTENAGAAGTWYAWTNTTSGITTGSPLTLAQIAAANPGKTVDRVYLTEGMGNSYNVSPGVGTKAWVDSVTIGTTTYNFGP
jgi:hypothetical protein